jgi:hypothetical protein
MPKGDDHFGMLYMLRVAHNNFKGVYTEPFPFDEIVKIAAIVHRYDATTKIRQDLVSRIPDAWKKDAECFAEDPRKEQWLFVAWVLGFTDAFRAMLASLVQGCTLENGELMITGELLQGVFPTIVLKHIRETREAYLQKLLDLTYDWVAKLAEEDTCRASDRHNSQDCAAAMCGWFLRGLANLKEEGMRIGLSKPQVAEFTTSIYMLRAYLINIEDNQYSDEEDSSDDVATDDAAPWLNPDCRNKATWEFIVDRELRGIKDFSVQFHRYLLMQREKWAPNLDMVRT